jgi:hypothetical protein
MFHLKRIAHKLLQLQAKTTQNIDFKLIESRKEIIQAGDRRDTDYGE